jgi:hypothetical protein
MFCPHRTATTTVIGRCHEKREILSRLGPPGANRFVLPCHRKMVELGPERTVIGGAAEG